MEIILWRGTSGWINCISTRRWRRFGRGASNRAIESFRRRDARGELLGWRDTRAMSTPRRTLEEVRRVGMEALARELGPVDFVRCLQLFETGRGNYTEERHQWLDGL